MERNVYPPSAWIPMSMAFQSTTAATLETTDPRILRSRRMLMEALGNLLNRKEFDAISIQEIADEAALNRGTFYLHYPDKNALLRAMTAARFHGLVEKRGLSFTTCSGALRTIALGVCDFLAETTNCPSQLTKMPIEGAIIPVVAGIFLEGRARHGTVPDSDAELRATTAAWAVYGAARHWLQTPDRVPAEEIATEIESLVTPILMRGSQ